MNSNTISNTKISVPIGIQKGCHPKGSTTISKIEIENKIELAKDKMAILYKAIKDENGGVVKNRAFKIIHNTFKIIHHTVLTKFDIHNAGIKVNDECTQQQFL